MCNTRLQNWLVWNCHKKWSFHHLLSNFIRYGWTCRFVYLEAVAGFHDDLVLMLEGSVATVLKPMKMCCHQYKSRVRPIWIWIASNHPCVRSHDQQWKMIGYRYQSYDALHHCQKGIPWWYQGNTRQSPKGPANAAVRPNKTSWQDNRQELFLLQGIDFACFDTVLKLEWPRRRRRALVVEWKGRTWFV